MILIKPSPIDRGSISYSEVLTANAGLKYIDLLFNS